LIASAFACFAGAEDDEVDVAKVTQVLDLGDGVGGVVAEDEVGTFGVGVKEFAVGGDVEDVGFV